MLYLVFLLFIPNIYSEVADPNAIHSINKLPWDAYEYAKNISIQLSNELFLNLNPDLDSLTEFRTRQYVIPRNGKVSYNGNNYLTPDDSIRNGSFNVQTIDDWTIIEFTPNFRNFSVRHNFSSLSESLGIDFDYLPVNITIKRHNGNGRVEAIIKFQDTISSVPELSSYDNAFDYGSKLVQQLSAELINWLDPENRFLQPELDDIVKSLTFPMENITEQRWKEIVHKTTLERQQLIYKTYRKVYEYAQSIGAQLLSQLDTRNVPPCDNIDVTLPSNLSNNSTLRMESVNIIGAHVTYRQENLEFKPNSFSVQLIGNVTTLKLAPVSKRSRISYRYEYDGGMLGTFTIVFNNIPINIEIEHRSDSGETKGKVYYNEMKDHDWWIETVDRSAVSNFLVKKYYESPEFKRSLCPIFAPGSIYLQSELDEIIEENIFANKNQKD